MTKKIIIVFLILIAILFAFYIFSGKKFQRTITLENISKVDNSENSQNENTVNEDNNPVTKAPSIDIKPSDCDSDCAQFTVDAEKEYCQEICGTQTFFEDADQEGGTQDDCKDEKGVQKDYCLKDIAVGNKDFKVCREIKNASIKKSCQNRITEDRMEENANSFAL